MEAQPHAGGWTCQSENGCQEQAVPESGGGAGTWAKRPPLALYLTTAKIIALRASDATILAVAVDIDFQHHRWMVRGPSRVLRRDAAETKLGKVKPINKKVDHSHGVIGGDIIFKLRGKHRSLAAIDPAHKARHQNPPLLAETILRQNHFLRKLDFSHNLGRHRTRRILKFVIWSTAALGS